MGIRTIKFLIIPIVLMSFACSLYVGRDRTVPRSIWDDCFVGRFQDPGKAQMFFSHNRSMVTINGEKDPSSTAPWETFVYIGFVHVPDIKGELTLFFPEDCDPECSLPSVQPIDASTGENEIAVNFVIPGGTIEGCTPGPSDLIEFSFSYIWEGVVHSETIAARRE